MADAAQPVRDVLLDFYADRGLSNRKLSAMTKKVDALGLAPGTIGNIVKGTDSPGLRALNVLAATLEIDPRNFAEYQLAVLRAALDPNAVGLDQALANMRTLGAPARRLVGAAVPAPRGVLGRLAGDPAPTPGSQPQPRKRPAAGSGPGSQG